MKRPSSWAARASVVAAALGCGDCAVQPVTYGDYGERAVSALERSFYQGNGTYSACAGGCAAHNQDWGDDSLTYTLYLHWSATHDPSIGAVLASLVSTATRYSPCRGAGCDEWSDVPEWDAIADEREWEVTGSARALELAVHAYEGVRDSDGYALGACPEVRYQRSFAGNGHLKTLETDSNAIKAALLLWAATGQDSYLAEAKATYAAARRYFLDPGLPLYTVYLFDDGTTCAQVPKRFFASVNGNMIWSGSRLASATGDRSYLDDALRTATAVGGLLADGRGVFADLQAENDVVEPLVEAFYVLATEHGVAVARSWIIENARAAIAGARTAEDLYGRFFDGPPPTARVTAWQESGGASLVVAAAALAAGERVPVDAGWSPGRPVQRDITALPSSLDFTGSGIALYGTLGEHCCEGGHASVAIDGRPTVDQTGIWQNKSSAGASFEDTILFVWRWPASGAHTLTFGPSTTNAKEGGPFLHVQRYVVLN